MHEILKTESLCLTRVDCNEGLLSLGFAFWEYFFDLSKGLKISFHHVRESGFRNLAHIYLLMECLESLKIVESVTLRFEGRDTAEAIQNPTKDWNPESEFH